MKTINVYMKTYSKDLKVYDFSDIKTGNLEKKSNLLKTLTDGLVI